MFLHMSVNPLPDHSVTPQKKMSLNIQFQKLKIQNVFHRTEDKVISAALLGSDNSKNYQNCSSLYLTTQNLNQQDVKKNLLWMVCEIKIYF
jgi:hypothetical protein